MKFRVPLHLSGDFWKKQSIGMAKIGHILVIPKKSLKFPKKYIRSCVKMMKFDAAPYRVFLLTA